MTKIRRERSVYGMTQQCENRLSLLFNYPENRKTYGKGLLGIKRVLKFLYNFCSKHVSLYKHLTSYVRKVSRNIFHVYVV
jgi:hypothetical protein